MKRIAWIAFLLLLTGLSASSAGTPDITRMWFTPAVVPENYTQPVRFEATVTNSPATVGFQYGGVGADRPMYDDGTHGDLVAGDGTWTILFQPNEILSRLTAGQVYRPFIGFCKPAGGSNFNIFAEVWTSAIGLVNTQSIDAGAQRTDYIVNLAVPVDQLINFNATVPAKRFYSIFPDNFDFLNFVHIAGARGNRYHAQVRNSVSGIGVSIFNSSAAYGSGGRLMGYSVFPLSSLFDSGETAFNHETGHQWINFLQNTPFATGIPHWPKGNIAINTMGFSIPGSSVGGTYSFTFTSNGQGGYVTGAPDPANVTVFNSMELYLMGLVPPSEVGSYFVLKDQNRNVSFGETLLPADITIVTVNDVIAALGPRSPDSTTSPKSFRSATIVLSEQLLDPYAMSLYDWFARRAEETQPLACSSGFLQSTCRPFYPATGGRATMTTKLDLIPRPSLVSVVPSTATQGQSANVTLTGTNFVSGMTIDVGLNVAVSNINVTSSTSATATLTIAPSAITGNRNLTVTTAGGTSVPVGFTVNPPSPTLISVTPNHGSQGGVILVTMTGTNFTGGLTIAAGTGISVSDLVVFNSTQLSAQFSITPSAALGLRPITVTTAAGGTSNNAAFTIDPPALVVRKSGTGSGSVTSNPAGIDCGLACSTSFTIGQIFALTATPAAGSVFAGWSGDADCIDGSVTMTAARNCVARFELPQSNSTLLRGDYDGDGKTDIVVYRPSTGEWFLRLSTRGYVIASGNWYFQWGVPGDIPLTGDFDGDGKIDISVYRPASGEWFSRLSTQSYAVGAGNWYFQWGLPGDVPITGDFDGDGKTDISVFRPGTGEWFSRLSAQNYAVGAGNWYFQWGLSGDQPLVGDFDADSKTDIGVYRPSTEEWFLRLSTQNYAVAAGNWYYQWGVPGDQPVASDFDGDRKTDLAVYRPATGEWFLRLSTQNYAVAAGNWFFQWGAPGDLFIKGDFDGDTKADIAVYRPSSGEWFFRLSTQGYTMAAGNWYFQWGIFGDLPLRR